MNLIFMGTPEFAVPSLTQLIAAGHRIIAVFTQPDKPVGRKQIITPSPVKLIAQQKGIPIYQPTKIKTQAAREQLEPLFQQADAGTIAAYGRILPDWMLNGPRRGCINVHSSLLPKYRGAAPINWAVANGEQESGVTIMQMDAGLDTGAMLLQRSVALGERENAADLTLRLSEIGAELLVETLVGLERNEIVATAQDDSQASYAPILKREDGEVDWTMTARQIANRQRGFVPFPGCYTFINDQRLELTRVAVEPATELPEEAFSAELQPGTICGISKYSFVVKCGDETFLRIEEVQPAGKRVMSARDFLNGAKLKAGAHFGSHHQ